MCWTCCIENLKAQIAKEDINVYKVVRKADKESCVSLFIGLLLTVTIVITILLEVALKHQLMSIKH